MKFKVFKLQELIYKKVAYVIVSIVTMVCIYLYFFNGADGDIAYILSIVYALILFIVSLYFNNMSILTQNMFLKRKEQYRSLKELNNLYKHNLKEKEDLTKFIFMAQAFTGRISPDKGGYIKLNGFEYKQKYLKLEENYLKQKRDYIDLITDEINNYVVANKIIKKVVNVYVHDLENLFENLSDWIEKQFELTTEEKEAFSNFINNCSVRNKLKLKRIEKMERKIIKMINKTHKKSQNNFEKIEEIYGDMLFSSLYEDNVLSSNFAIIEGLIKELKSEVLYTIEFEDSAETHIDLLEKYLSEIDEKLDVIYKEIEELKFINPDY